MSEWDKRQVHKFNYSWNLKSKILLKLQLPLLTYTIRTVTAGVTHQGKKRKEAIVTQTSQNSHTLVSNWLKREMSLCRYTVYGSSIHTCIHVPIHTCIHVHIHTCIELHFFLALFYLSMLKVKILILGCHHSSVDSSASSLQLPRVWDPSTPSMLLSIYIWFVLCGKDKINKKRTWLAHFLKNIILDFWLPRLSVKSVRRLQRGDRGQQQQAPLCQMDTEHDHQEWKERAKVIIETMTPKLSTFWWDFRISFDLLCGQSYNSSSIVDYDSKVVVNY